MRRNTAQDEQVRQHVDDVIGVEPSGHADRQSVAGEFADDVEHAEFATVMRAILQMAH